MFMVQCYPIYATHMSWMTLYPVIPCWNLSISGWDQPEKILNEQIKDVGRTLRLLKTQRLDERVLFFFLEFKGVWAHCRTSNSIFGNEMSPF
jgi:hypothetical protein